MENKKTKIAFFDIDGTIFRSNLQYELLSGLAFEGIFNQETKKQLTHIYRKWLNNEGSYEEYKKNLIEKYRSDLKGKRKKDVVQVSKKVMEFYHARTFNYTRKLIKKLRNEYLLVAISGSPIEIVKEYNKYLKFDDVFGTVYEINKRKEYTGREIYTPVHNKADALRVYIAEKGISLENSVGIGDTESDIPLLELVDNPIAFNSDMALYKHAKNRNWKIIVERKDVIYEM